MKFSAYCKCGLVAEDAAKWREHVKTCAQLQEVAQQGAVEIRYPDLAPLRDQEPDLLRQHGFRVWKLPRYARIDEKHGFTIEEEPYGESLPVYVCRTKAEPPVKHRALNKISKSTEAQKALVSLLQCTDMGEHAAALTEFADHM